ncbi:MAG: hypothetical protein KGZ93_10710 [Actinobacteria bacterium]|jgi:hypothetical protein|nr:hypothetical protein [Actinomycetota bacterium]
MKKALVPLLLVALFVVNVAGPASALCLKNVWPAPVPGEYLPVADLWLEDIWPAPPANDRCLPAVQLPGVRLPVNG